jgi:hypothetical protein
MLEGRGVGTMVLCNAVVLFYFYFYFLKNVFVYVSIIFLFPSSVM